MTQPPDFFLLRVALLRDKPGTLYHDKREHRVAWARMKPHPFLRRTQVSQHVEILIDGAGSDVVRQAHTRNFLGTQGYTISTHSGSTATYKKRGTD